jgi:hypothetical protein
MNTFCVTQGSTSIGTRQAGAWEVAARPVFSRIQIQDVHGEGGSKGTPRKMGQGYRQERPKRKLQVTSHSPQRCFHQESQKSQAHEIPLHTHWMSTTQLAQVSGQGQDRSGLTREEVDSATQDSD